MLCRFKTYLYENLAKKLINLLWDGSIKVSEENPNTSIPD